MRQKNLVELSDWVKKSNQEKKKERKKAFPPSPTSYPYSLQIPPSPLWSAFLQSTRVTIGRLLFQPCSMVATINGMIAFYTVQSGVRRQYNEPIGAQESPRLANQNAGRWDIPNTDKEKKKKVSWTANEVHKIQNGDTETHNFGYKK